VNAEEGKGGLVTVAARWLSWMLLVLTPALVCSVVLSLLGLTLTEYAPETNDEVGYYLQAQAFVHKGLASGYFTMNERPAGAHFSHFGVHGPLFPVLYGLVGKAIGWRLYSGPLFNIGFMTLALAIFCLVIQPTTFQALVATVFLASYWPLYLSLISNGQDPIHSAAAVLFATGFAAILQRRPFVYTPLFQAAFWLLLIYTSLMRISWSMMVYPYLMLERGTSSRKQLHRQLLAGTVIVLVLLYGFRRLCAPYLGDDTAFMMNKIIGLEAASVSYVLGHAWHNFQALVTGAVADRPCLPATLLFYESVSFGAVMAIMIAWSALYPLRRRLIRLPVREGLFHCYNIWALTIAMIFLYYVNRNGAWRMYSSHFLMAALMVIVSSTPRLVWLALVVVGINLTWSLPCLETIAQFNISRFGHLQDIRNFAKIIEGRIVYQDGADPWRNTVLSDRYAPCYVALPPGIGVSTYFRPEEFPHPSRSKYVLTNIFAAHRLRGSGWPPPVCAFPLVGCFPRGMSPAVLLINPRVEGRGGTPSRK
jgi:hypothetical protein